MAIRIEVYIIGDIRTDDIEVEITNNGHVQDLTKDNANIITQAVAIAHARHELDRIADKREGWQHDGL